MPTSNRRAAQWLRCFALVFMLVPAMAAVVNAAGPLRVPLSRLAGKAQQMGYLGERALERRLYGTTAPLVNRKVVALPVRYAPATKFPVYSRAKL
jgi:hypothetical protein